MKISIYLVVAVGISAYIILPLVTWFLKPKKFTKPLVITLLLLYILVLCFGVWGRVGIGRDVTVKLDFSGSWCDKNIKWNLLGLEKIDVIINTFMLIPIGLVYMFFSEKKLYKDILILLFIGLCVGVLIESSQFVLPVLRSVQLSDVILNSISVLIGGLIGSLFSFIVRKSTKN